MLARLALLASLLAVAGLGGAQLPPRPEPEFTFVMSELAYSSREDLVPGTPLTVAVPVRRLCALEMAVLDEQQVLVTLGGPAFRFEGPLFLDFPASLCHEGNEAVELRFDVFALGELDGSQSFTVRLDPQRPANDLHGPGEPQTLLIGIVVANQTAEPAPAPVAPPKESPLAASALSMMALLVAAVLKRRRARRRSA